MGDMVVFFPHSQNEEVEKIEDHSLNFHPGRTVDGRSSGANEDRTSEEHEFLEDPNRLVFTHSLRFHDFYVIVKGSNRTGSPTWCFFKAVRPGTDSGHEGLGGLARPFPDFVMRSQSGDSGDSNGAGRFQRRTCGKALQALQRSARVQPDPTAQGRPVPKPAPKAEVFGAAS